MSRLLDLYPADWRDRYGAELAGLLAERPPGPADRIDLLRGAIDARLHPELAGGGRREASSQRVPGIVAVLGGAIWAAVWLGAALSDDPARGGSSWAIVAIVLMSVALIGRYMAAYRRAILSWLSVTGLALLAMAALPWGPWTGAAAIAALALTAGLMLFLAMSRAGVGWRAHGRLVGALGLSLLAAFVVGAAISMTSQPGGAGSNEIVRSGALTTIYAVGGFVGIIWVTLGTLMAVGRVQSQAGPPRTSVDAGRNAP